MLSAGPVTELASAAETAGWEGFAFTEHPAPGARWLSAGGHQTLDPFVALANVAAVTERLVLLTNLAVVPYRNPLLLAKAAATVDIVSNGRFVLGAGTGYLKSEFHALGVDFDERNALFDEALDVLPLHWSGEPFSYEGRHFAARDLIARPWPVQQPIPVWIGGNSKLTVRRVAERAQGWMPLTSHVDISATTRTPHLGSVEALAERIGMLRELAARGPAPSTSRSRTPIPRSRTPTATSGVTARPSPSSRRSGSRGSSSPAPPRRPPARGGSSTRSRGTTSLRERTLPTRRPLRRSVRRRARSGARRALHRRARRVRRDARPARRRAAGRGRDRGGQGARVRPPADRGRMGAEPGRPPRTLADRRAPPAERRAARRAAARGRGGRGRPPRCDAREREVLERVLGSAIAIAGSGAATNVATQIGGTLQAASTSADAGEMLRQGRLVKELQPSSGFPGGDSAVDAPARAPRRAPAGAPKAPSVDREAAPATADVADLEQARGATGGASAPSRTSRRRGPSSTKRAPRPTRPPLKSTRREFALTSSRATRRPRRKPPVTRSGSSCPRNGRPTGSQPQSHDSNVRCRRRTEAPSRSAQRREALRVGQHRRHEIADLGDAGRSPCGSSSGRSGARGRRARPT